MNSCGYQKTCQSLYIHYLMESSQQPVNLTGSYPTFTLYKLGLKGLGNLLRIMSLEEDSLSLYPVGPQSKSIVKYCI